VTLPLEAESMTLAQMCSAALQRDPEREAIEFAGGWVHWGQIKQWVARIHSLMHDAGLPDGEPVVFIANNRPSGVAALLALLAQGRSVQMVYGFQAPAAIARELESLEPALVVAAEDVLEGSLQAVLRVHAAAAIALTERDATLLPGLERCQRTAPRAAAAPASLQLLTSGTTGRPKRIAMPHDVIARHFVNGNKNYKPSDDLSALPPLFSYYPLGNVSGIYGVLPPLLRGQRVTLVERFTVDAWREHLRRHRPERASLPSAGFQMVLDADVPVEELSALRCVASGAAPLELSVHRAFEAKYNVPILISYGATEFGGPVTSMTPDLHKQWGAHKLGSAGRPLPGVQLRVVDADSGVALPAGREGILEVVSPCTGAGWIRTSDLAVLDADGFLFHRGRADGAIMRGGFKVLPETIERALRLHPAVAEAAVVGLTDARLGQVPAAAVQLKPSNSQPDARALEAHLREHTLATHIPVAWRIVPALPRTVALKLDYSAVRALFASG
jgi:long-chain acyl-CoA synthetase